MATKFLRALSPFALLLSAAPALAQAPGANWKLTPTPSDPPQRRENPGAADFSSMYVFGGQSGGAGGVVMNDLWRFDGAAWTLMTADGAPGSPPARARAGVTWNFARNRLTVFGGDDALGNTFGDTWEWDPVTNTWSDVTPVGGSPSPRRWCALAHDYANGKVLLFGGLDASGTHLNDTWHFDGLAWTQLSPAAPLPVPRRQHLLVERIDRSDVILAAGQDASTGTMLGDTWQWNGSQWTQVPTSVSPAGKVAFDAAYDVLRGRIVVAGGNPGPTGQISEFDADLADWVIRPLDPGIYKVTRYFMAFVPFLGKTYKVSGQALNAAAPADKTYEFQSDFVASLTASGTGCPGTAGQPAFTFTGKPWLGESYSIEVAPAAPTELVYMYTGVNKDTWFGAPLPLDLAPFGAPGCLLYLAPIFGLTKFLGTGPVLSPYTLNVPNDQAFLGAELYHQAFLLDGATLDIAGTELATAAIGIK